MDAWVQGILTGISLGSAYGLLAIGISVVHKASGDLNLSHGSVAMAVGMILAHVVPKSWPVVLRLPAGALLGAVISLVVWALIYIPFGNRTPVTRLTAMVAIMFVASGLAQWRYGTNSVVLSALWDRRFRILGGTISGQQILTILVAAAGAILVGLVFARTMYGRGLRALADDSYGALSVGARPQLMLMSSMMIAGLLAGVAAMMLVPLTGVSFASGFSWTLLAVTSAVIGGINSLIGAALGGIVLGITNGLLTVAAPEYFVSAQYVLLLGVLAIRPKGILGNVAI